MLFKVNVETFSTIEIEAESKEALLKMIEDSDIPDEAWETMNIFQEDIIPESIQALVS